MRRLVALALLAAACAPGDYTYSKRIDGPYRILAIDDPNDMSVCYREARSRCNERILPTVTAVGWSDLYIVATRQSDVGGALEYFYIDRRADSGAYDARESVHGPFSAAEFEVERARLGLPELMRDVPFIYGGDSPRRATFEDIFRN